ncbi:MAG: M48 family metalloprotease [Gaiellaceae bacterium]
MAAGAWLALAALLWRTSVPSDLRLPELHAREYFPTAQLARADRYERVLRVFALLAPLASVAALGAVAWRAPELAHRLRGGSVVRGVQLAATAFVVVWAVRLPFGLAALWWRRRFGIAREDYLDWLVRPWPTLLGEVAVLCLAVAAVMAIAARSGRHAWLASAGGVAAIGAAAVVLQPLLLAPRFEALREPALTAEIRRVEDRLGLGEVQVRRREASERTRAVNAEVVGLGPTRRVVLWDTLLDGSFPPRAVRAIAAHELAHVSRRHVWKGLGWFLLVVGPGMFAVDLVARRRGGLSRPEGVAAGIATAAALVLVLTPAIDAVSRRYETEADWVALEATRDPAGARGLLVRLAATNLADPDPPGWWRLTFRTHPSLLERVAMAEAWARRHGRPLPPPRLAPRPASSG